MKRKVCLITGGTSGIGLYTAKAMADGGYIVYEISRREQGNDYVHHFRGDITDESTLAPVVDAIIEREGHIDVVINNAGFGISGAVEFTPTSDAIKQFDVNFFGMVRMNRLILPVMRRQGYGRIINISSVAGAIPIPFQTYYSATKAAMNSYTMSLANEVRDFGISVCCVQPGDIRTGFTDARMKCEQGDDIYRGKISKSVGGMERDEQSGMSAEGAGRFIYRVATRRCVKPVYTIGLFYQLVCLLTRVLPRRVQNFIVGRMYA